MANITQLFSRKSGFFTKTGAGVFAEYASRLERGRENHP